MSDSRIKIDQEPKYDGISQGYDDEFESIKEDILDLESLSNDSNLDGIGELESTAISVRGKPRPELKEVSKKLDLKSVDPELLYYRDQICSFVTEIWPSLLGVQKKERSLLKNEIFTQFNKAMDKWQKLKPDDLVYEYFHLIQNKIIPLIANRTKKTPAEVKNYHLQLMPIKRAVIVNNICDRYIKAAEDLIKKAKQDLIDFPEPKESKQTSGEFLDSKLEMFKKNIAECRKNDARNLHYHPEHEYARLIHQEIVPFIARRKQQSHQEVVASLGKSAFIPRDIKTESENDVFWGKVKLFAGGALFLAGLALSFGIVTSIISAPMMVAGLGLLNSGRKTYSKGKLNLIPFKFDKNIPKSPLQSALSDSRSPVNKTTLRREIQEVLGKPKLSERPNVPVFVGGESKRFDNLTAGSGRTLEANENYFSDGMWKSLEDKEHLKDKKSEVNIDKGDREKEMPSAHGHTEPLYGHSMFTVSKSIEVVQESTADNETFASPRKKVVKKEIEDTENFSRRRVGRKT